MEDQTHTGIFDRKNMLFLTYLSEFDHTAF